MIGGITSLAVLCLVLSTPIYLLRTLQQDQADSTPPSALRPWHARSFVDSAVQRLSVALQRSIQRDQILRSHLRRGTRGSDAAPDGYYGGCGDGGYASGASSSSSSDGGGGGAGGFGGGEHSVSGGSASGCSGSRPGVPHSQSGLRGRPVER